MQETPQSVVEWIDATFGNVSRSRYATRANEEMAELLTAVTDGTTDEKIREECADVVICLMKVCAMHGGDLQSEINKKMAINRARKWKFDASGCGYHELESNTRNALRELLDANERAGKWSDDKYAADNWPRAIDQALKALGDE